MPYRTVYTDHGEEKRREEGVPDADVRAVLSEGTTLRRYPDARKLPRPGVARRVCSAGTYEKGRPLHVVAADDEERRVTWIITIYEPDPDRWTDHFKWKPSWKSTKNTWKE